MRLHVSCESTYEPAHEISVLDIGEQRMLRPACTNGQTRQSIFCCSHTQKFGYEQRLGPNFRPLVPLNTSTWTFEESFWALAISTKIRVLAHIDDLHEISFVLKKKTLKFYTIYIFRVTTYFVFLWSTVSDYFNESLFVWIL